MAIKQAWLIWLLTTAILVSYPLVSFVYFSALAETGLLLPDGDSIGIPIFGNLVATIILSPFVLLVTGLCLRRYNPRTRLAAWRQDRPVRSYLGTTIFGSGTAFFLWASVDLARLGTFWFDYLWVAYFLLWVPFLLSLRAALVDQLEDGRPKPNGREACHRLSNW